MSDSMIQAMQRMDAIRARIQEIQQLSAGQAQSSSLQSGADPESGKVDSSRFAMLLQEAAGSLSGDGSTSDTSAQQLLSGLAGASGLTGGAEGPGALSSLGPIDPALIARALEQYRSQK